MYWYVDKLISWWLKNLPRIFRMRSTVFSEHARVTSLKAVLYLKMHYRQFFWPGGQPVDHSGRNFSAVTVRESCGTDTFALALMSTWSSSLFLICLPDAIVSSIMFFKDLFGRKSWSVITFLVIGEVLWPSIHDSMAILSYVFPSESTTGSDMRSPVIGQ